MMGQMAWNGTWPVPRWDPSMPFTQNQEEAFYEAERLGHKPVLALDPFDWKELFQCPINTEYEQAALQKLNSFICDPRTVEIIYE